jgi:hypothetical protein
MLSIIMQNLIILSVTHKPLMLIDNKLNVVMLSVTNKIYMLRIVMLKVVMLGVANMPLFSVALYCLSLY